MSRSSGDRASAISLDRPIDDRPAFAEPWEAHAFAMAVALNGDGLFTWTEWADALAAAIALAQAGGDPDTGASYYRHWLSALESIVAAKGAANGEELSRYAHAWQHAAARTPHGAPIALEARDFDDPAAITSER